MNNEQKEHFEDRFQAAISQSLRGVKAKDDLRSRLYDRLSQEPISALPADLSEETSQRFADSLSAAVHRSQCQAPAGRVVLQVEAALSQELQRDVLSERSVIAVLEGEAPPQPVAEALPNGAKFNFLRSLHAEIARNTQNRTAPLETRARVLQALKKAKKPTQTVVPFPNRSQWARGLSALTSLAAGFAILFVTLFTSTDVALANSVRADHVSCCKSALNTENSSSEQVQAMLESEFGPVPVPPVTSSWVLRASQICKTEEGKPMVHLLYARTNEENKQETMSMHFIPKKYCDTKSAKLSRETVQALSDDNFPVVAWMEGDWVCTACSPDLDMAALRAETDNQL